MKDKMISQELLEILGDPPEAITHEHTSDNEGKRKFSSSLSAQQNCFLPA